MKIKGVLFIIIGILCLYVPILVFKGVTSEYGNSTEPVLVGFRLLFIFGGLALIASGIGNVIEGNKRKNNHQPILPDNDKENRQQR